MTGDIEGLAFCETILIATLKQKGEIKQSTTVFFIYTHTLTHARTHTHTYIHAGEECVLPEAGGGGNELRVCSAHLTFFVLRSFSK